MRAITDRAASLAALQDLMDELCSPDLTLSRSKALRAHLDALLATLGTSAADLAASHLGALPDGPSFPALCELAGAS